MQPLCPGPVPTRMPPLPLLSWHCITAPPPPRRGSGGRPCPGHSRPRDRIALGRGAWPGHTSPPSTVPLASRTGPGGMRELRTAGRAQRACNGGGRKGLPAGSPQNAGLLPPMYGGAAAPWHWGDARRGAGPGGGVMPCCGASARALRSGCLTSAVSGTHAWAQWLHHPCLLGGPQHGDKIRSGYLTPAFSGPRWGGMATSINMATSPLPSRVPMVGINQPRKEWTWWK